MAAFTSGVFDVELSSALKTAKVLVVGAGGIGSEILKNIVLTGFKDIEIVDLDTIDVSNLNRQFLFHKRHVGESKAKVARESALRFNPDVNIKAHHANITSSEYGIQFFKKFSLVMNALDNRAARNHVNRMCLAADVPLIESGTAGYDGQVELILKNRTQCYECLPKAAQKTYPGCTIRNTPSEPIHCIVWAKHLFNQLFGEDDPDEDVSPDTEDPEAAGEAGEGALNATKTEGANIDRVSTRSWAVSCNYDPKKLMNKLFCEDIRYLLSMKHLWEKRTPPTPITSESDLDEGSSSSLSADGDRSKDLWSLKECVSVFTNSCMNLNNKLKSLGEGSQLIWDKDDKDAMDFVAACANIRAHIFKIPRKSRFEIKSMAGNIIPAIATTNAIIAGIVVLHAINILQKQVERCQSVYLRLKPNHRNQLIVPEKHMIPPNPKCYVCSPKPEVTVFLNVNKVTVKELEEHILKKRLNMVAPDVMLDLKGTVIISSEDGETAENNNKTLSEIGITDGTVLKADDFLQNYELSITIMHKVPGRDDPEFEVVADKDSLKPKEEDRTSVNGTTDNDDDDIEVVDADGVNEITKTDREGKKRKSTSDEENSISKKPKLQDSDIEIVEV
ncbi:SUMO-activating enzyme subunit 2 [Schistocerca americana]|uniref:SUMO-activating enzyme subunit 2 n=1 Tax=Schistocerca americana TaxID=7009 RepID=UPI001F4FB367|nr:SUMO-activating enzyme subunit 2 [Schistocerca americana]